jgi:hypothetical protein
LDEAAENMKRFTDYRRRQAPEYEEGDWVLLDGKDLHTGRPSKKLDHRREGPFKIEKKIGDFNYKLKLPRSWKVHPIFGVSKLWPYNKNDNLHPTVIDDTLRPPPDVISGQPEYHVEKVVGRRKKGRSFEYLVKWFGYPDEENTWEPRKGLMKHASDAVHDYEDQLQLLTDVRGRPSI